MKAETSDKWIVCRICIKQPNERMHSIFDNCEEEDLIHMIHECGGVPIKRYDNFPDKICTRCLTRLRTAYNFRETCQRSYRHLGRFIAPVTEERQDTTESLEVAADIILETEEQDVGSLKEEPTEAEEIKQEFEDVEDDDDGEIIEMYEPIEFDMEISEEMCALEESCPETEAPATDDVEFLEDFGIASSDEEYLPNAKPIKRLEKNKTKEMITKIALQKPTTSRKAAAAKTIGGNEKKMKIPRGKRSKESAYICDVCGNIYPSQGRLTEHIKLHKGIKPHDCEICGHAFAQTQQLARHMNTHTGNRPYKCNYCPAAFADLSTRNKHHRIHTNERPYVCDVCHKAFTYTNTLKFHKMIHTGEKPHVCEICGKGFQQAYKLRNHRYTHERKGIRVEKIKVESLDSYPDISVATGHILEI